MRDNGNVQYVQQKVVVRMVYSKLHERIARITKNEVVVLWLSKSRTACVAREQQQASQLFDPRIHQICDMPAQIQGRLKLLTDVRSDTER